MDLDKESGLIRLTENEQKYTGLPDVIPVEEIDVALGALLRALARTNAIDPSEFPAGATKNHLLEMQHREMELAQAMMDQLVQIMGASVIGWAEDITRGEN